MESIIQFLSKIDLPTLLAIAAMFWMMKSYLDKKFEKIDRKFEKIDERFTKVEEKITDIDKRVFAIETMLHMKDCCMLKDDRQNRKMVE